MKSKYLFLQKGGSLPLLVKIILGIIVFCLVIYLIYEIWLYLYKNQTTQETQCLLPKGCLRVLAVTSSSNHKYIKASSKSKFKHNEYGITMWMYVYGGEVNNQYFKKGSGKWDPVIYRGSQHTCQPGVWISKETNRLLIRWDTTANTKKYIAGLCDNCTCNKRTDLGNRKRIMKGEKEVVGVCACGDPGAPDIGKKKYKEDHNLCDNPNFIEFGGHHPHKKHHSRCKLHLNQPTYNWFKESDLHYSLDPNKNPPLDGSCNGMRTGKTIPGCPTNSKNSINNTPPQCCVDNIPLDRWFHLAIVGNEQVGDVYIDGKLFKSVAFSGNVRIDHNKGITVGGGGWGNYTQVRYFASSITPYDVLKIYSWGPHPLQIEDPRKVLKNAEADLDKSGRYIQRSVDSIHVDAHGSAKWDKGHWQNEADGLEDY